MLEDIMGWNWTNIFLGIIAFTIVRIYLDFSVKVFEIEDQLRNISFGNVKTGDKITDIYERIIMIEHNTRGE